MIIEKSRSCGPPLPGTLLAVRTDVPATGKETQRDLFSQREQELQGKCSVSFSVSFLLVEEGAV